MTDITCHNTIQSTQDVWSCRVRIIHGTCFYNFSINLVVLIIYSTKWLKLNLMFKQWYMKWLIWMNHMNCRQSRYSEEMILAVAQLQPENWNKITSMGFEPMTSALTVRSSAMISNSARLFNFKQLKRNN